MFFSAGLVVGQKDMDASVKLKLENGSWLISNFSILAELLND